MDASALLLGLAGGGTIGLVLTTLLRHSHERDERHRERALQAATDFLAAYERADSAVRDVQGRAHEARSASTASKERTDRFLEMGKDFLAAARDLPERDTSGNDGPDDSPFGSAIRALHEVHEVTKAHQVAPSVQDVAAVGDALSQIDATLPRLADMPPPFREFGRHLREVLSDLRLTLRTGEVLEASMRVSEQATNALQARRPMVQVLFASDGHDVVQAAVNVMDRVSDATRSALLNAMQARDGFDNDEARAALASAAEAASDFAVAVSGRVRPQQWWHLGASR